MNAVARNDDPDKFAGIANAVPVLIAYVDQNLLYQFVNKEYQNWFGKPPADIVGRSVQEVVGTAAWKLIENHVRRSLAGEVVEFETMIPYRSAGKRFVQVTYTPDRDSAGRIRGMVALIRDISAQRIAEVALRKEHQYISTILSTTAALIVVLDAKGRIVHVNRAFEFATGRTLEEVQGLVFFKLFLPEEEQASVLQVFQRLVELRNVSRHVNAIRHRDGSTRLIEWLNNVVVEEGKVELIIGTGLDITDRRALEREILSIGDAERHRIGQELHDNIGQRLTALEMFIHAVKSEVKAEAPAMMQRCDELSVELRAITKEVRILSHGLAPVSLRAHSLQTALEQLVQSTRTATGVNVTLNCSKPVRMRAADVPIQLYRIAQEALHNALKHSKATQIEIALKKLGAHYVLSITDNGVGLRPDTSGGMGLRLMQHRAELIGGHLTVISEPQVGTTIQCKMPV